MTDPDKGSNAPKSDVTQQKPKIEDTVTKNPVSAEPSPGDSERVLNSIANDTDIKRYPSWRDAEGEDEPPIIGLHSNVQSFITSMCKARKIPRDFVIAPMIAAISAVAGSRIKVSGAGYTNQLNLFIGVVATSTSGKSGPAAELMRPLEIINKDLFMRTKREREYYEAERERRSKIKNRDDMPQLERPKEYQLIVSDITDESRIQALTDNPHGILQYNDELDTFINNLGKYTKSNEIGQLITIHDGRTLNTNRIGRERTLLEQPYFSLFGTIQPRIAEKRLATEDFYLSGFTPRLLLFTPSKVNYKNKAREDVSDLLRQWSVWVEEIYRAEGQRTLIPCEDADKMHDTFMDEAGEIMTETNDDNERSVIGKLKISVWKLAGIAHVLNEAAQGLTSSCISANEMEWAISLCKYSYRRHMALLEQTELAPKKNLMRDAVINVIKARPDVNMAELARLLGIKDGTVRQIKNRYVKNGL